MTIPRIYFPRPLSPGDRYPADVPLARYLGSVLRMRDGDPLLVFNGGPQEYDAILQSRPDGIMLAITDSRPVIADGIVTTLCQAIPKADRMEAIIRHAVELGADRVIPFFAARSVPRWSEEKSPQKRSRWQKIAIEACRQCGRADLPEISEVASFATMLEAARPEALNLILWEEERGRGIRETLRDQSHAGIRNFLVIIGPEGGFSEPEVQEAKRAGCFSVSLGKRVLRVDTATAAALTALQYERGDIGAADRGDSHGG